MKRVSPLLHFLSPDIECHETEWDSVGYVAVELTGATSPYNCCVYLLVLRKSISVNVSNL